MRLKPNLWDKRAYFVPKLLRDDVLRLRPHFVQKQLRTQFSRKRAADQPEPVKKLCSWPFASGPDSTCNQPSIESRQGAVASRSSSDQSPSPQDTLSNAFLSPLPSTLHVTTSSEMPVPLDHQHNHTTIDHVITISEATTAHAVAETDDTRVSGRNQYSQQLQNSASTRQRHIPPLSDLITCQTWQEDFAAAKQKYFDKYSRENPKPSHEDMARDYAHYELISGRYGVRAVMACDICSENEQECRTYHPQCYQWDIGNRAAINQLGWRCMRCRRAYCGHGCNVQWY